MLRNRRRLLLLCRAPHGFRSSGQCSARGRHAASARPPRPQPRPSSTSLPPALAQDGKLP